jgi:L-seryl-tRNA(Ser) seleniumtransferase
MKVGKEEMIGLLAALEWTLAQDDTALLAGYEAIVQGWIAGLAGVPGVTVARGYPSEAGQPHGRAVVTILPESGWTRDQVIQALWDGDGNGPHIAVGTLADNDRAIALNPQTLQPGEERIVLDRLRAILASRPTM